MGKSKRKPQPQTQRQHFAIGLPVTVREGALPCGWPEDDDFSEYWYEEDYGRSFQIQEVGHDNEGRSTYSVAGWHWYPEDLQIAYY